MAIIELLLTPEDNSNPKFGSKLKRLQLLLKELHNRSLSPATYDFINAKINSLNTQNKRNPKFHKELCKVQNQIIKYLEKHHKIVPKGYYQQLWMAIGMGSFGMIIGVGIGMALGSMAYLGIGLPIGMAIGLSIGAGMDQKAAKEDRQLNFKPGLRW